MCVSFFRPEFLAWLYVNKESKSIKFNLDENFICVILARTYLPISQSHSAIGLKKEFLKEQGKFDSQICLLTIPVPAGLQRDIPYIFLSGCVKPGVLLLPALLIRGVVRGRNFRIHRIKCIYNKRGRHC